MQPATEIVTLDVHPLDIPLRSPFGISGGAQAVANNVLVAIRLADGTVGYGEAAPLPPYNGETQADALRALNDARLWLLRRDAAGWRELGETFRTRSEVKSGSAQCALEMALLDAVLRRENTPMWRFFGGAGTELETDMTITTGDATAAGSAAHAIRGRGIRWLKVKIGGPAGAEHDLARLAAIREAAPDSPLILDANAGLSRETAAEMVAGLRQLKIEPALLEQWLPKDDLEGMRELGRQSGWRVAADEAVATVDDVERIAREQAAQVVNIKLMKAGIATALEVAHAARAAGLELMIGGNIESILAMTTAACFAAGLGGFRHADLDTPLFLATNPFRGGFVQEGGRLSVAGIAAGHGVEPAV